MYCFDTDTYYKNSPVSLPRDPKDMATIFEHLTLLLVGELMPAPHELSTQSGGRMRMHDLH